MCIPCRIRNNQDISDFAIESAVLEGNSDCEIREVNCLEPITQITEGSVEDAGSVAQIG
jgi:hypothetical protein